MASRKDCRTSKQAPTLCYAYSPGAGGLGGGKPPNPLSFLPMQIQEQMRRARPDKVTQAIYNSPAIKFQFPLNKAKAALAFALADAATTAQIGTQNYQAAAVLNDAAKTLANSVLALEDKPMRDAKEATSIIRRMFFIDHWQMEHIKARDSFAQPNPLVRGMETFLFTIGVRRHPQSVPEGYRLSDRSRHERLMEAKRFLTPEEIRKLGYDMDQDRSCVVRYLRPEIGPSYGKVEYTCDSEYPYGLSDQLAEEKDPIAFRNIHKEFEKRISTSKDSAQEEKQEKFLLSRDNKVEVVPPKTNLPTDSIHETRSSDSENISEPWAQAGRNFQAREQDRRVQAEHMRHTAEDNQELANAPLVDKGTAAIKNITLEITDEAEASVGENMAEHFTEANFHGGPPESFVKRMVKYMDDSRAEDRDDPPTILEARITTSIGSALLTSTRPSVVEQGTAADMDPSICKYFKGYTPELEVGELFSKTLSYGNAKLICVSHVVIEFLDSHKVLHLFVCTRQGILLIQILIRIGAICAFIQFLWLLLWGIFKNLLPKKLVSQLDAQGQKIEEFIDEIIKRLFTFCAFPFVYLFVVIQVGISIVVLIISSIAQFLLVYSQFYIQEFLFQRGFNIDSCKHSLSNVIKKTPKTVAQTFGHIGRIMFKALCVIYPSPIDLDEGLHEDWDENS